MAQGMGGSVPGDPPPSSATVLQESRNLRIIELINKILIWE